MVLKGWKVSLSVCVLCVVFATSSAQNCNDISTITQDSQLLALQNSGCKSYPVDFTIGTIDCSQPCQVTVIPSLEQLLTISGAIKIYCCPNLLNIDGFTSLTSVQSIDIYYNSNLTSISAFIGISSLVSYLRVSQNPKLQSMDGFTALEQIGSYVEIDRNPLLTTIRLDQLTTISGGDTVTGNALSIGYNTALTSLSAFVSLRSISYGTVRIEGNTALCYAGYPQWGEVGAFASRTGGANEDKGIDWRPLLSGNNPWQYTWGLDGGGTPTLVIRDNAPAGSCGSATPCSSFCDPNAGCLGPGIAVLCGSCSLIVGGLDPCDFVTVPPAAATNDITGIIVGVVVGLVFFVALLIMVPLVIWGCFVVGRRYKELRQGSFDISVNSVEDGFHLRSSSRGSQQIATVAEPTTGSNVTRKGVKHTPKLDSVVVSSYKPPSDYATDAPDSYTGQRSKDKEVSPVERSKPSRSSRPKSDSSTLDRTPKKKASGSSLLEGTARESSTEDILTRMREENAEIPMNYPWEGLKLGKEFGTGDFGKVFHAEARKLLPGQKKTAVMVKKLKEGASEEERETFLRPVEAMKILQHPNVLSLLGVSMKEPSICVLLEYCSQGNFKTFLVRKRRESMSIRQNNQLITMAIDMAAGLDYLHSVQIAHNDFAARSCLVTGEGKVKLGDYGITRQTFREDYYARRPSQKALPIRWMAPELIVVKDRNTLDSLPVSMPGNIWSFGVALWEVCSFAQWPYDDLSNEEVLQTLKTTGQCILENPLEDTDHISPLFDICQSCWQSADLRPSMSEVHSQLQELTNSGTRKSTPVKRASQVGGIVKTTRPKSQSFYPSPREEPNESEEPSRRATQSSAYKPRRPAPSKPARPAPGRPTSNTATFPRSKGKGGNRNSQEEPLVISNTASLDDDEPRVGVASGQSHKKNPKTDVSDKRSNAASKPQGGMSAGRGQTSQARKEPTASSYKHRTDSTEALLTDKSSARANERGTKKTTSSSTSSTGTSKSKSLSRHDPLAAKKKTAATATKKTETTKKPVKYSARHSSLEPDRNKRELPHLTEMHQAVQDEQAMNDEDEDFILDPPQRFSQDDDLEEVEPVIPTNKARRESNIERKIRQKKAGKILSRQNTPSNLGPPDSNDDDDDIIAPDATDHDYVGPPEPEDVDDVVLPNTGWESGEEDEEEYRFDRSDNAFDQDYDEPAEAMEEDELPEVVYDEDVAALIW